MKVFLRILSIILLFVASAAKGQFTAITHASGTVTYGGNNVTVTPAGGVSTISYCGASPYWVGSASSGGTTPVPGSYTFSFSIPINAFRVYITAANTGESIAVAVNGSHYSLTAANIFSYSGTCGGPAMVLSGDTLLTPTVAGSPGACAGINVVGSGMTSATISTNGLWSGSVFTFMISDTILSVAYNNGPICSGDTLKLFDTGGTITSSTTFNWYGPGGFTSTAQFPVIPNATVADSGLYYCVRSAGDTAFTHVVINPAPPVPSIGVTPPICSGRTLNLTATDTAGATYNWVGPNGFSSTLQNPSITGIVTGATGTYTLTCSLGGCTSLPTTVYVLVDSTPAVPTVSATTPLCSGDSLVLTSSCATPGIIYNWSGPASYASTSQNPVLHSVVTAQSGNYTVTVIKGICTNQASVTVVINQVPTAPVTGSTSPMCSGGLLTLTAYATPSTGTYYWSGPLGFTSMVQNPSIGSVPVAASGIYSVYEIVNGCISPTSYDTVVINPTPAVPTVWSNARICEGDTLELHAIDDTSGVVYSWIGPSSFTSTDQHPVIMNVPPTANGIYTVTATLGLCSASNVTNVGITVTPPLSATYNNPVCTGDTLKLIASSDPGNTFVWVGPYSYIAPGSIATRYPAISEYTGVYTVTVTEPGGCHASTTDTIRIRVTPSPPWVPWLTYCQYAYAPPMMAVEATDVLWFPSSAGGVGTVTAPTPNTNIPGIYFFYLNQTMDGCVSEIDSIQVIVNPKPVTTLNPKLNAICPHDTIRYVATNPDVFVTYQWYPSLYLDDSLSASVLASPITDIHYQVVATNQFNCTDTQSADVSVYAAGIILMNVTDSVNLYPGESFHIQPMTNCTNFSWFPPSGLSDVGSSDPTATPELSTVYFVDGTTEHGCKVRDSIYFHINEETLYGVPNAFSPGNGVNNIFKLYKKGIAKLNYFRVFDRWGVLVFETNNIEEGWDGNFKGAPQPLGVYVYDVQAVSGITNKVLTLRGNVTLLR